MGIYDNVKKLCDERNISMLKMENAIGISAGSSSKWRKSAPSSEALVKIADFFNVSTDVILGRDEMQKNNSLIADAVIKCVANPELAQLVSDVAALDPIHYEALRLYLSALNK